jgi:hypothetical protein
MPAAITLTLTDVGLAAALDAIANGITLSLTQIGVGSGKYTPTAARTALTGEIARYPLSGGDVEPNSKTLRFSTAIESNITVNVFEVGLFSSTGVLFAVASTTAVDPLFLLSANVTALQLFGMVVSQIPAGSLTVATDPNAPIALAMMTQHVAAADSHPQYAMKGAFDGHVTQNAAEHDEINERITLDESQLVAVVASINLAAAQINKVLPKVGDIKTTANAMTAAAFTAAQANGSVWEVYGAGRVIVGAGSVTIDYSAATGDAARANVTQVFAAGGIGGEIDHKQTTAELRAHAHARSANGALEVVNTGVDGGALGNYFSGDDFLRQETHTGTIGSSTPFNVMQPYIVACHFVCVTAATPIPVIVLAP